MKIRKFGLVMFILISGSAFAQIMSNGLDHTDQTYWQYAGMECKPVYKTCSEIIKESLSGDRKWMTEVAPVGECKDKGLKCMIDEAGYYEQSFRCTFYPVYECQ